MPMSNILMAKTGFILSNSTLKCNKILMQFFLGYMSKTYLYFSLKIAELTKQTAQLLLFLIREADRMQVLGFFF